MKKSDFYYDLPEELIAQTPVEPRNSSRLMKIDRKTIPTFYADVKGKAAEEQILVKSVLIAILTGLRLSSTFDGELSAFN